MDNNIDDEIGLYATAVTYTWGRVTILSSIHPWFHLTLKVD
jgi:hypothetical protein